MKNTSKLKLNKPDLEDFAQIQKLNENMDIIDGQLGQLAGSLPYSQADKNKVDGYMAYVHPSTHPASMITDTADKVVMTKSERDKLSGLENGANKYVHPASHPASMITQDSNNRFSSDSEKNYWNGIPNLNKAKLISVSTNLNSLVEPNFYICDTDVNCKTLINRPSDMAFYMLVGKTGANNNNISQIVFIRDGRIKQRTYNIDTNWTTWREFAYLDNLTKNTIGLGSVTNDKQAKDVDFQAHLNNEMPHVMVDHLGVKHKYGFKMTEKGVQMIYE